MPIYEYVCPDCGSKFELLRPFSQADKQEPCPNCHCAAERKLSTFACFSRNDSGEFTPVAGAGGSCAGCSSASCSSCGL